MSNRALPHAPGRKTLLRRRRLFLFALLGLAIVELPGRGDAIILKDGYTIYGKVVEEQTQFFDPNGQSIITKKMNGLSMVGDGARWTVFSPHYKRLGDVSNFDKYVDYITFTRTVFKKSGYPLPPLMQYVSKTEFNSYWVRTLTYNSSLGRGHKIEQQIAVLTPHYIQMVSITHQWTTFYLTKEFSSEEVRKWLKTHPDLVEKNGPEVGKRAKLIRFLIQTEWLSEAMEEIDRLEKDLPNESKRAEELREEIRTIRLESQIADIERAKEGGSHAAALAGLKQIPKTVPAKMTLKVATLKAEYDAAAEKLAKAQKYLKALKAETGKSKAFEEITNAADMILSELHLDTAGRLDLFIVLAEQAEKAVKDGKAPLHRPEQLLAAAITGWSMGANSTETDVTTARKHLKAREMALSYLRSPSGIVRRQLLANYEADTEKLAFDELDKLISLLPPPEADKELVYRPVDRKTTPLPGSTVANYRLVLPPEYQHGRAYPLLLVLPRGGQRMAEMTTKQFLGDLPGRNGYICAVVDWNNDGTQNTYNYTEEEQAIVTGVLRHLRRTLQVDSDRVFLFGLGEGATMAIDLGATHPDKFAGIIPMGATPDGLFFRVFEYWKNFQYLPVYFVSGDTAGDSVKVVRDMLHSWMSKGYPALAVLYKGRTSEWFKEELPNIFDWMGRKTRQSATLDLGKSGEEFRTIRASANRFYWIGLDEIENGRLYDPARRSRQFSPTMFQAHIKEGNNILVEGIGMNHLTIWFGKGSVDYAKPVYVKINGNGNNSFKTELSPKISVLLEDLYDRGDRQRPYYQRIDCQNIKWLAKFSTP